MISGSVLTWTFRRAESFKTVQAKILSTFVPQTHSSRVQFPQVINSIVARPSSSYAIGMNSKHLAAGSSYPPLKDGKVRIYNMRFCPYGQRALLVAEAKGIAHDIVNVSLKDKPEWLLERNPAGKVPTIETPKGPLYESLIVAEYLDEVYPTRPLSSSEPYQKALDKIWTENFTSVTTAFYKVVTARDDKDLVKERLADLSSTLTPFENELKRRGTVYFAGDSKPGMLDYMIWPWFERLGLFKVYFPNAFDFDSAKEQKPSLDNWRKAMKEDPAVKAVYLSNEDHLKYYATHISGSPDYDVLLK